MRSRKVSPSEPVSELRRIKIIDNGEKLVDYLEACPKLVVAEHVFDYRYESVARERVVQGLCIASESLPKGISLAMHEGWRPHHIQRRMYMEAWNRWKEKHPEWSDTQLKRVVNRFTAPLNDKVPPPHSTGGAVDVWLVDKSGERLDFRGNYDFWDAKSFPFDAKDLTAEARENRLMLKEAMEKGGISNYPSEWWHWSYGDQGWAYRTGAEHALYGVIEPDNYQPDPRDVVDEPVRHADGS